MIRCSAAAWRHARTRACAAPAGGSGTSSGVHGLRESRGELHKRAGRCAVGRRSRRAACTTLHAVHFAAWRACRVHDAALEPPSASHRVALCVDGVHVAAAADQSGDDLRSSGMEGQRGEASKRERCAFDSGSSAASPCCRVASDHLHSHQYHIAHFTSVQPQGMFNHKECSITRNVQSQGNTLSTQGEKHPSLTPPWPSLAANSSRVSPSGVVELGSLPPGPASAAAAAAWPPFAGERRGRGGRGGECGRRASLAAAVVAARARPPPPPPPPTHTHTHTHPPPPYHPPTPPHPHPHTHTTPTPTHTPPTVLLT